MTYEAPVVEMTDGALNHTAVNECKIITHASLLMTPLALFVVTHYTGTCILSPSQAFSLSLTDVENEIVPLLIVSQARSVLTVAVNSVH